MVVPWPVVGMPDGAGAAGLDAVGAAVAGVGTLALSAVLAGNVARLGLVGWLLLVVRCF